VTKILNNLDHNKDRGYSCDALGRLVQANKLFSTLKHSFDNFPTHLIPAYGNFCSNANTDSPSTPAVDLGDDTCKQHDDEYQRRGRGLTKYEADKEFLKSLLYLPNDFGHSFVPKIHLLDIAFGTGPSIGSTYHFIAIPGFVGLLGYRRITGNGRR